MQTIENAERRSGRPLVLIFLLLATGLLTAGYFYYRNYEGSFRTGIEHELSAVTELQVAQIVQWRRERLADANYLRNTPYAARRSLDVLAQPTSVSTRKIFTAWLDSLLAGGSYDQVLLLDERLNIGLAYPGRTPGALSAVVLRAAQEALRSNNVVIADLHRETATGPVYLTLMVPLVVRRESTGDKVPAAGAGTSAADRSTALLVLQINANQELYPLIRHWPTPSRTAETMLVRRDGNDALFLNDLKFQTNTALNLRVPLERTYRPSVKAALGQQGMIAGQDYRGVPVVAALRAIPDSPWSLVTCMDLAELYAPVRARLWGMVALIGVLLLAAGAGVMLVWRRQRLRFYEERHKSAAELEWKTAFLEAQVNSSIDGILVVSPEGKKTLQNQKLVDLFEIPQAIADGNDDAAQVRWVTDRTKHPDQFVKKVLHLYAHPDEISRDEIELKDGTILDRYSSPVIGRDGKHYGRIWTFRDITEGKQAEGKLVRIEELYRRAIAGAGAVPYSSDYKTKSYVFIGEGIEQLIGYAPAEVNGQLWQEIIQESVMRGETAGLAKDEAARRMATGEIRTWRCDMRVRTRDGKLRWLSDASVQNLDESGRPTGSMGILEDITERKQAEAATQQVAEQLTTTLESLTDGFFTIDREWHFTYVNREAERIFGLSRNELLGNHIWAKFPEARDTISQHEYERALRDNVAVQFETFYPPLGVWLDARAFPSAQGLAVYFRDITGRKGAEETLRLLSSAVEQSKESILITDAELDSPGPKIIFVNPAFTEMTGYSAADVLGKTPRLLQGPLTDRTVLRQLRQNLKEGEGFQGEALNYRKDGTPFVLEWQIAPIRNADGKVTHFVAIQRDITARKQAENALRESDEKFHQLADNITDAFWIRSPDLREVHYVSPAFERIWGRSVASLYAHPEHWADFIFPEDRERVLTAFAALTGDAPNLDVEYRIVRPDGKIRWVRVRGFQVRDTADKVIRHIGIVSDITERKQVEAQLFQSQKMETVGKLAGGVAHEFNSIMTVIIGHSEFLLNDLPPASPLGRNATEIRRAAERAATLTRQLLAYGRKQFLQPEVLDLNAVLAGLESTLRNLLGQDVDVRLVPAARLKAVKADASQIEQVIMNLAINAREAMPNGGKLMLETANVTFDADSVGGDAELKPGDYVMLAITDTGMGMSAEVKARLFEPFFSTKDIGQGTGLGLSTCYGIIKQSGGHIGVYSEPARGTTFKIYLPQVTAATAPPLPRLDSLDLPRGAETILLVEDDPALRVMATTLLSRLGYTVLPAANGVEALKLKQQRGSGHIDLLFTDVVMPHMSGQELADRVRALFPHTRILFTSAYTENAIVHQGVLNQGVALLQKPFTPSALAHKLREVLDAPGATRPEPAQKTFGFTKSTDGVNTP